ncbi:hypothetical protein THAOC_11655, partial [Thalassiosira oceanica]
TVHRLSKILLEFLVCRHNGEPASIIEEVDDILFVHEAAPIAPPSPAAIVHASSEASAGRGGGRGREGESGGRRNSSLRTPCHSCPLAAPRWRNSAEEEVEEEEEEELLAPERSCPNQSSNEQQSSALSLRTVCELTSASNSSRRGAAEAGDARREAVRTERRKIFMVFSIL